MKVLRSKNLFGILFSVLLAMPLLSILGRTAYTIVNKNAYQSYSGTSSYETELNYQYKYQTNEVYSQSDLIDGHIYHFKIEDDSIDTYISGDFRIGLYIVNIQNIDFSRYGFYFDEIIVGTNLSNTLPVYLSSVMFNDTYVTYFHFLNNLDSGDYTFSIASDDDLSAYPFSLECDFIYKPNNNNFTCYDFSIFSASNYNEIESVTANVIVNDNGKLDNAFEYSVSKFVDNNNFGELDFFEWFDNLFLDSTNETNMLYVHFINWYLNYALLISLAYLLFSVLNWFIQYIRRLLDKGMNIGNGSY